MSKIPKRTALIIENETLYQIIEKLERCYELQSETIQYKDQTIAQLRDEVAFLNSQLLTDYSLEHEARGEENVH